MKYVDEYRAPAAALPILEAIRRTVTRPWTLMEVCGGQTHSIVKHGLLALLPSGLELLHGPGCPVCVTPLEMIDRAHALTMRPEVTLCSFGDMLRVPGSDGDLLMRKARGADVRVVYSPLDAVNLARANPTREIVFFAIGFETTAPATAMAAWVAKRDGVRNFSLLVSHVLVPPAMTSILEADDNRVQAFLGPGHVCTIMGTKEYEPLVARFHVPIVISGFEPVDLLDGIHRAAKQLEAGCALVENAYGRVVQSEGNVRARKLLDEVFEVTDRAWRGFGVLPQSGLRLRDAYSAWDAEQRFDCSTVQSPEPAECICGQILKGVKKPLDCTAFAGRCTPESPLGATMVSSEGACAAYYHYTVGRRPELPTA